ncbi:MAG TPA: succinate dehydrogenase, hydrophobic membrane anchor protein [Thiobacillus sp.]|jgi:succinate dehydrogenase / fumarate reductase membrane anchor subunit|nr:MAG: succinate dehydrogenase, hydrophobic membrane anchor protein [Hydrogenophilales bacterium 16-64-40]OZA32525.1 MAG: succinate dehydrogenase, hydrophobic membrane anchor protein [Hydrogenophilales bacterium 17-64-65]HQS81896.1 succinate dehydrogenase, hydrophobic membrane anchor protein [Thiobacillus sp.]HQT33960.1 succinate dehydrogenase, hydrophobic membrane anchor protein [Thiobacillus sp.]
MKAATGSHIGTGTWLLQHATAVALALALPGLAIYFLAALPFDFSGWQALFAPLWLRVLMLLTMAALALHAWVGMRDIFMDYVHHTGLRLALYLAVIVTLAGSVAWLAATLWSTA